MNVIELDQLTKKYGDFKAVDNASFAVKEGEIFGFLGPNGAGKTTTVSMLTTLKRRTSGKATVNGYDTEKQRREVRGSIGIVFQDPSLDEELTVHENLKLHAVLYGLSEKVIRKRIKELLKLVGLNHQSKTLVRNLSGGMKRRLEIARGFMHYPKVLFLDEPTVGLDPQTRHHIWDYIEHLNKKEKVTIVLTTHYMEEAEKLAHRIAIMDQGRIIALDTPQGLKGLTQGQVISFHTSDPARIREKLAGHEQVSDITINEGEVSVTLAEHQQDLAGILNTISASGVDLNSMTVHSATLEDVYINMTGKSIREDATGGKAAKKERNRARR